MSRYGLIWYEFPCDGYSSGVAIELSCPVIEMVENNSLSLYEQIVDFRNGKPLMEIGAIENKIRMMGLEVIKNSTQNIISTDSKYDRIKRIYQLMKTRKEDSKAFFSKFDIVNPYKLMIAYGKFKVTQDVSNENMASRS